MSEITIEFISAFTGDNICSIEISNLKKNVITIKQLIKSKKFLDLWISYITKNIEFLDKGIFTGISFVINEKKLHTNDNFYHYHYNVNGKLYITLQVIRYFTYLEDL